MKLKPIEILIVLTALSLACIPLIYAIEFRLNEQIIEQTKRCEIKYGPGSTVIKPGLFTTPLCKSVKDKGQLMLIPNK